VVEKTPTELHALNRQRSSVNAHDAAGRAARCIHFIHSYRMSTRHASLTAEQRQQLVTALRQLEPKPMRIISTGVTGKPIASAISSQRRFKLRDGQWLPQLRWQQDPYSIATPRRMRSALAPLRDASIATTMRYARPDTAAKKTIAVALDRRREKGANAVETDDEPETQTGTFGQDLDNSN